MSAIAWLKDPQAFVAETGHIEAGLAYSLYGERSIVLATSPRRSRSFTAGEARRLARRLIELAGELDGPEGVEPTAVAPSQQPSSAVYSATVAEVAELFSLSERTIRRYVDSGRLTAYRVGPRALRLDPDEVRREIVSSAR